LLQIAKQSSDRPIDFEGILLMSILEIPVLIPLHVGIAMRDLNESHTSLCEPPRQQALAAKVFGNFVIQPVLP
jgi:hypothetical protein